MENVKEILFVKISHMKNIQSKNILELHRSNTENTYCKILQEYKDQCILRQTQLPGL